MNRLQEKGYACIIKLCFTSIGQHKKQLFWGAVCPMKWTHTDWCIQDVIAKGRLGPEKDEHKRNRPIVAQLKTYEGLIRKLLKMAKERWE